MYQINVIVKLVLCEIKKILVFQQEFALHFDDTLFIVTLSDSTEETHDSLRNYNNAAVSQASTNLFCQIIGNDASALITFGRNT